MTTRLTGSGVVMGSTRVMFSLGGKFRSFSSSETQGLLPGDDTKFLVESLL